MALIEFKDLPDTSTPLNAENLNNNFNEVKIINNNLETKYTADITFSSFVDQELSNISIKRTGNVISFSGVVFFNASPGVWNEFMRLPEGFFGTTSHGVLIEESTGFARPVVISDTGVCVITSNLSSNNIYTYITGTIIVE